MKKLLILAFFFTSLKVSAQTTCDTTFRDFTHYVLKHLDKSQIPTGVLYEYAASFIRLKS